MPNAEILFDTDNYVVRVGDSLDFGSKDSPRDIYQIVNIHTQVVEREELIYPSAVMLCKSLSKAYDDLQRDLTNEKVINGEAKNVVTIN